MRRRGWTTRDALLWWSVLGVCAAIFVLHVNAVVGGQLAWLPVTLARAAPGEDPQVAFVRPDVPEAERAQIATGDRVVAAGSEPLRGRGGLAGGLRLYSLADEGRLALERVRGGANGASGAGGDSEAIELGLVPIPQAWRASALALSFLAIGALTYRRAPRHAAARLFFLGAASYAVHWSYFFGGPSPLRNSVAIASFGLGVGLALPLALRSVLVLPEDVARRSPLARFGPWAFAGVGAGAATWAFGGPLPAAVGMPIAVGGSVVFLVTLAAVLLGQWRRTGAIGRRQLKWILVGTLAAFVPPLLAGSAALVQPELAWVYEISLASLVLLPLAVFAALVREHLLDVDRLLTSTFLSSLLAGVLLAAVIVVVPSLAEATEGLVDPSVSQPALALAAALGVLAVRGRIDPWLQDRLFPERAALEAGADDLRRDLSGCEKPSELFDVLGRGLARRLRVASVVVYGRADDVFAPVFDRGDAMAPAFPGHGALVDELGASPRVADLGTLEARLADDPEAETERHALEAMGTELLLPIHRDDVLEAFVCLGQKPSGERYGASELALLQSIVDKVSDELRRFDLEEVHREEREMVRLLRRYVPEAVARRLADRTDMPSGEVDATVLFVDLRGYTRISEEQGPARTFSLVNRYTEAVSAVVDEHGGTVVDFQGDGLMAVFGAPDPLPDKERRAVAAGRAVVERVHALPIDADNPALGAPDLRVGIASGPAFVGPLRAVDRTLWGVLGDTTNLAARLQGLAKDLEAAIVVDEATRAGAGELTRDFVAHPETPIRGRHGRVDLHALPRGAAIGAPATEESR